MNSREKISFCFSVKLELENQPQYIFWPDLH